MFSSGYLFLLDSVLEHWVSINCPFLLGCQVFWQIIVHIFSLCVCVSAISVVISVIFHFLFYVGPFYFLLTEPVQKFINFVYTFKEPVWVLFFLLFFKPLLFFLFDRFTSFLLLTLSFVFFLILLDGRLHCLFELFCVWLISLWMAFATFHRLFMIVFPLSFVSRYILIFSCSLFPFFK